MSKISGPLLDRIDIHIEVPAVPFKQLSDQRAGTSSEDLRQQVVSARNRQERRFQSQRTRQNAQMSTRHLRAFCGLSASGQELLHAAVNDLGLSARAHDKILRVSRTIADLEDKDEIDTSHLSEAINYRLLDRTLWT